MKRELPPEENGHALLWKKQCQTTQVYTNFKRSTKKVEATALICIFLFSYECTYISKFLNRIFFFNPTEFLLYREIAL